MYLHKDGIVINHKRVERLYSQNKMQLKNRKKGHKKYSVNKREEHILTEKVGNWIAIDRVKVLQKFWMKSGTKKNSSFFRQIMIV